MTKNTTNTTNMAPVTVMDVKDVLNFKPKTDNLSGAADEQSITEKKLAAIDSNMLEAVNQLQEMGGNTTTNAVSRIPFFGKKIKENVKVSAVSVAKDINKGLDEDAKQLTSIINDNTVQMRESQEKLAEVEEKIQRGELALENIHQIAESEGWSLEQTQAFEYQLNEKINTFGRVKGFEVANQASFTAVTEAAKMVQNELEIAKQMVPSVARSLDAVIKSEALEEIYKNTRTLEKIGNQLLVDSVKKTTGMMQQMAGGALAKEQDITATLTTINSMLESNQMTLADFRNPNSEFNKKLLEVRSEKNVQLERLTENNAKLAALDVTDLELLA